MPCFKPLQGYRSLQVNPSGRRSIVFSPAAGYKDLPVEVPCGQCVGCRLERSRQWAIRCVHESQLHFDNAFITLTYDDGHLPPGGTLVKADFQKFMKRLRARQPKDHRMKYYMCGEYGTQSGRPHYHACLFGYDFPDRVKYTERNGVSLYTSEVLQSLWTYGFSTVGDVTFESAAYVARYIMKKITGEAAAEHYHAVDSRTGELTQVIPEYNDMSRRPGIGADWYKRFKDDLFPEDECIVRGRKMKVPRYYSKIFEQEEPTEHRKVRRGRIEKAAKHASDNTRERLEVKEAVAKARLNQLKREI